MKLFIKCLILSELLTSCSGRRSSQIAALPRAINYAPLDSLNKAFLVHARDSAKEFIDVYSDTLIGKLTQALQKQQVDTILYFRGGCSGCEILADKGKTNCLCTSTEEKSWLFWQYGGHTFAKKLDCCQNYPIIPASPAAFIFYYQNSRVFAEGIKFYRELKQYNESHPTKPYFLPQGPIHDLDVSYLKLYLSGFTTDVNVRGGTYDSVGNPLFMKYEWRRKEWQWAKLLDGLTSKPYRPR